MMLKCCVSSGKQIISADITTVPTLLYGMILVTGSNACSAIATNGASGTEMAILNDVDGTVAAVQNTVMFDHPVVLPLGLSVALTGTNSYYYVFYQVYGS